MRHYGYISDGPVLIERFEQAERVSPPLPFYSPGVFDNAVDLDDFYITAHMGIDHETGEVVDELRSILTTLEGGLYTPYTLQALYGEEIF